ncbi:hypothetical protein FHS23_003955 [Prauserella isguenensis]|uniref:DUF559 domain-containing protein n=1 Tax=Prauserella isguenensis TaxID=1470180 RepID=A0A839S6D6_9PSEU|nr:hypothetical protein [Prauserella isguenensis]
MDTARSLDVVTRSAAGLLAAGPGAVVSRSTAAVLHGCSAAESSAADNGAVHVTVPYGSTARSRGGLIVHRDRFADDDIDVRHGLPVFSLVPTLAELLCVERRWVALAAVDQVLAGMPEDQAESLVHSVRSRLAVRDDRRGVPGGQALLQLATGQAESPQESRLRLLVVDAGFPLPTPQFQVFDLRGRLLYVFDLAWPDVKIALEYDGFEAHEDRGAYDAERDRKMADRGWLTVRVRKEQLAAPEPVLGELWRAFEKRGRPLVQAAPGLRRAYSARR